MLVPWKERHRDGPSYFSSCNIIIWKLEKSRNTWGIYFMGFRSIRRDMHRSLRGVSATHETYSDLRQPKRFTLSSYLLLYWNHVSKSLGSTSSTSSSSCWAHPSSTLPDIPLQSLAILFAQMLVVIRGVSRVWQAGHMPWAPLAGGFWFVWVSTF
jgi:hypothetical protein